jgi:hypothetical protein
VAGNIVDQSGAVALQSQISRANDRLEIIHQIFIYLYLMSDEYQIQITFWIFN